MLVQTYTSTQAPNCRRLQPSLVYQLPLEGSYNPLSEGFDPQHYCRPRFINFHTGSTSFHTTYLVGHQIFSVYLHQFFMISSVIQTRDSSSSDHYIHGCIVVSDLSVKNRARPYRYSFKKFLFTTLAMHTLRSLFFFSLYIFSFIKTMSQNHEPLRVFLCQYSFSLSHGVF